MCLDGSIFQDRLLSLRMISHDADSLLLENSITEVSVQARFVNVPRYHAVFVLAQRIVIDNVGELVYQPF